MVIVCACADAEASRARVAAIAVNTFMCVAPVQLSDRFPSLPARPLQMTEQVRSAMIPTITPRRAAGGTVWKDPGVGGARGCDMTRPYATLDAIIPLHVLVAQ